MRINTKIGILGLFIGTVCLICEIVVAYLHPTFHNLEMLFLVIILMPLYWYNYKTLKHLDELKS